MFGRAAALLALILVGLPVAAAPLNERAADRAAMVETLRAHARTVGGMDQAVYDAMARVPRHRFVPAAQAGQAYADTPLPIGEGQTISQPFIVAFMTHLLAARKGARVLEIGTGSGYQAAVLAELGYEVRSIEIVRVLGERADTLLRELGYDKVQVRIGDGYAGWPDAAPFDGILVTAGTNTVPAPLIKQLKPGARLVLPLADAEGNEFLTVVIKQADGSTTTQRWIGVRFVPLTRGEAR
jgi:protein-L-isoaspartate(D-aspartate) O-methyltransferase